MIIDCVTPNAAVDRSLVVSGFHHGGVFRPQRSLIAAGGKGLNVARAAETLGGKTRCYGFIAGYSGNLLLDLAQAEGLECHFTRLSAGETRNCMILVDPNIGLTSVINDVGAPTSAEDWARLRTDLINRPDPGLICICGSLPPGSPVEAYGAMLRELVAAGQSVWVDTSGAALKAAVEIPGVHLKINDEEAAELTGTAINSAEDAERTAQAMAAASGAAVVITLGKDGAVMASGDQCWRAIAPPITVASPVGSGDSFLGALLVALADHRPVDQALRAAAAAGTANARSVGAGHFTRADFLEIERETRIVSSQH